MSKTDVAEQKEVKKVKSATVVKDDVIEDEDPLEDEETPSQNDDDDDEDAEEDEMEDDLLDDEGPDSGEEGGVVFIDRKNCLSCTHLTGNILDKGKTRDCTFENGNSNCPAHRFRIVVGMDTDKAVRNFISALQDGDFAGLKSIIANLEEHEDVVQSEFTFNVCNVLGLDVNDLNLAESED